MPFYNALVCLIRLCLTELENETLAARDTSETSSLIRLIRTCRSRCIGALLPGPLEEVERGAAWCCQRPFGGSRRRGCLGQASPAIGDGRLYAVAHQEFRDLLV